MPPEEPRRSPLLQRAKSILSREGVGRMLQRAVQHVCCLKHSQVLRLANKRTQAPLIKASRVCLADSGFSTRCKIQVGTVLYRRQGEACGKKWCAPSNRSLTRPQAREATGMQDILLPGKTRCPAQLTNCWLRLSSPETNGAARLLFSARCLPTICVILRCSGLNSWTRF